MQPFFTNVLLLVCVTGIDVRLEAVAVRRTANKWTGTQLYTSLYGKNTSKELDNRSDVSHMQQQYRGVVYLGTPPVPFTLLFDTGSSWLWVNHFACGTDCHPSCTFFDPTKSQTYFTLGQRVRLLHNLGEGEGILSWDSVALRANARSIESQALLTLRDSEGFLTLESDGILVLLK